MATTLVSPLRWKASRPTPRTWSACAGAWRNGRCRRASAARRSPTSWRPPTRPSPTRPSTPTATGRAPSTCWRRASEDDVEIVVRDRGDWRPPPVDPGFRGRGLVMIRSMSSWAEIEPGPDGTTVRMRWSRWRGPLPGRGLRSTSSAMSSSRLLNRPSSSVQSCSGASVQPDGGPQRLHRGVEVETGFLDQSVGDQDDRPRRRQQEVVLR